jgi:hypothetical protein
MVEWMFINSNRNIIMAQSIQDILASIREEFENESQERLLGELYFEEDLMELANPYNFGDDWGTDE